MNSLLGAAAIAGSVTTILGCGALVLTWAKRFPPLAKLVSWVHDGWREDREERLVELLDRGLAFNGTGRFRQDMKILYYDFSSFMGESREDRADLRRRLEIIQARIDQGEQLT